MSNFAGILVQYIIQTPLLVIWVVGIVLALTHWQRYPKVALATSVACGLFIIDTLIGTFLTLWLPSTMINNGQSAVQVGTLLGFIGAGRTLLHAILWVAILFAIFSKREPAAGAEALGGPGKRDNV